MKHYEIRDALERNPEDGRFLTEDTYRGETNEPDTWHLYVYCKNNPVNYVDPSGHKSKGYVETNHSELRTCTDGKIANKYERERCKRKKKDPYKDDSHDCSTSCFQKVVASDEIPYIVVPPSKSKYRFCSGVIINRNNGNYLYCVVAEVGREKKGMGEVSIYAAWRMRGWKAPNKNKKVPKRMKIGENNTQGSWKIIMINKSEPNRKDKYNKFGWKYTKTSSLRKQIKKIGKKYYKGGRRGKCLN